MQMMNMCYPLRYLLQNNVIIFFIHLGAAVFWVIGASIFVIGIHASFFNYDAIQEEVHDDKQQLTGNIIEDV